MPLSSILIPFPLLLPVMCMDPKIPSIMPSHLVMSLTIAPTLLVALPLRTRSLVIPLSSILSSHRLVLLAPGATLWTNRLRRRRIPSSLLVFLVTNVQRTVMFRSTPAPGSPGPYLRITVPIIPLIRRPPISPASPLLSLPGDRLTLSPPTPLSRCLMSVTRWVTPCFVLLMSLLVTHVRTVVWQWPTRPVHLFCPLVRHSPLLICCRRAPRTATWPPVPAIVLPLVPLPPLVLVSTTVVRVPTRLRPLPHLRIQFPHPASSLPLSGATLLATGTLTTVRWKDGVAVWWWENPIWLEQHLPGPSALLKRVSILLSSKSRRASPITPRNLVTSQSE